MGGTLCRTEGEENGRKKNKTRVRYTVMKREEDYEGSGDHERRGED